MRTFAPVGTCSLCECRYAAMDVPCTVACDAGACIGGWLGLGAPGVALRYSRSAVWTGTQMLVFGGHNGTNALPGGARFYP